MLTTCPTRTSASLKLAEVAEPLLSGVLDPRQHSRLRDELRDARELLRDWIDAKAADVDFLHWRSRHGRPFSPVTRVYVYNPRKQSA